MSWTVRRFWAVVFSVAVIVACGNANESLIRPPPDQTPIPTDDPNVYAWAPFIPAPGSLVLVDRETGSTFNLRGEAIAGPLAAERRLLLQVPGVNMFWFAWSVFFPGSEVWGRSEHVRDGALPENKTGSPACGGGAECIPSLPNSGTPRGDLPWVSPDSADAAYLAGSDLVLGVFYDGVARAYPHNILWWHEIANDHIGERRFSVTFCPLTGSGLVWSATDRGFTFGVSGNLFNSNLVMYDHATGSLWPQLWMGAVSNSSKGTWLTQLPASEMTWAKWQELHPDTLVISEKTGFSRNYDVYPYGDYRIDDADTFRTTTPAADPLYPNKAMTFGLADRPTGTARAYVHGDLAAQAGPRSVTNDLFSGRPVALVYEQDAQLVLAFEAQTPGGTLTFDARDYAP